MTSATDGAARGAEFFENNAVLARYRALRAAADGPVRTIEEPLVLAYLGEPRGRAVLDLGCGEAALGRYVLERGARRYVGVDGSRALADAARDALAGSGGEVRVRDLERWCGEGERFDVVVSRLVLHFVADLPRLLEVVRHELVRGGTFAFSIEHPLRTADPGGAGDEDHTVARAWRVRDYFREGARAATWFETPVLKYHRSLETYVAALRACGFALDRFSEGRPARANFTGGAAWERRRDVPICAAFRCVRLG